MVDGLIEYRNFCKIIKILESQNAILIKKISEGKRNGVHLIIERINSNQCRKIIDDLKPKPHNE